jgi:hypothetical protein
MSSYKDSDFVVSPRYVKWAFAHHWTVILRQLKSSEVMKLQLASPAQSKAGSPYGYEVVPLIEHDVIFIYDENGILLHTMEDKDGVYRGTNQEVHGSTAGSSSGSQPAGAPSSGSPVTFTSGPNYVTSGASQAVVANQLAAQAAAMEMQMQMQMHAMMYGGGVAQQVNPTPVPAPFPKYEGVRIGEIVAYRCWPIKNGFLWSTAAGRAWVPGEPMKAGENHIRDGLGVYAFKGMSTCIEEFGCECFNQGVAFGTIYIWGEIVEHELGYRAEYATIRSIDFVRQVPSHNWHPLYVEDLRKLYKVEGK